MDNSRQILPSIRFPEFSSSGSWDYVPGNELFIPIVNKNHNSDLPVLAITQDQGAVPRELIDYNVIVSDKSIAGYKVVEIGDFIISLRSFQGGIEYSNYKGLCSPAYIVLRRKNDFVCNDFYRHYFKSKKFIQDLNRNLEGIRDGKMISYQQFSEIKIPFPPLAEQKHIAECLSVMDDVISECNNKLEFQKFYKKGLMQKLFPVKGKESPELRFKEFENNGIWEEKKLGEIAENIVTGKLDANAMVPNGKYRFYTCAKTYYYINDYAFDTEALLVAGNGAHLGYIHYYKGRFNAYQRTYVLSNIQCNIFYLKFYLENFLPQRIEKEKKEGNTPYIVQSTLTEMPILLPQLIEQSRIADCFLSIEKLINYYIEIINLLEQHKKGLMQQLFPKQ